MVYKVRESSDSSAMGVVAESLEGFGLVERLATARVKFSV